MTIPLQLDPAQAHRVEPREPDLWLETASAGVYSDVGLEAERELLDELKAAPWQTVLAQRFAESHPWLYRVITDRGRALFLDFLSVPAGGLCLDVGSGWGQVAIPLSQRADVVCLDLTLSRLLILKEIASQEGAHLGYACGNFHTFPFAANQFDLIVFNGALEWLGVGAGEQSIWDAQRAALAKTQRLLKPGGAVYVGIENSLGLKYLLGAPDDHSGVSHLMFRSEAAARARCAEYGTNLRAKTWSLAEYRDLLGGAGLAISEVFGCFPDYKLIRHMIPLQSVDAELAEKGLPCPEHSGADGTPLAADIEANLSHLYRLLAKNKVAGLFCPSYGIIARRQ